MTEFLVDSNAVPKAWRTSIRDFSVDELVRCDHCMFHDHDTGWCSVWEAETIDDGYCFMGEDEESEDFRKEMEYEEEAA